MNIRGHLLWLLWIRHQSFYSIWVHISGTTPFKKTHSFRNGQRWILKGWKWLAGKLRGSCFATSLTICISSLKITLLFFIARQYMGRAGKGPGLGDVEDLHWYCQGPHQRYTPWPWPCLCPLWPTLAPKTSCIDQKCPYITRVVVEYSSSYLFREFEPIIKFPNTEKPNPLIRPLTEKNYW